VRQWNLPVPTKHRNLLREAVKRAQAEHEVRTVDRDNVVPRETGFKHAPRRFVGRIAERGHDDAAVNNQWLVMSLPPGCVCIRP